MCTIDRSLESRYTWEDINSMLNINTHPPCECKNDSFLYQQSFGDIYYISCVCRGMWEIVDDEIKEILSCKRNV